MESTAESIPTVWGVFVGNSGEELEVFNSQYGPFPPKKGASGYIAIGWPAIGDLRMFKDNYLDYVEKFRVAYGEKNDTEQKFKIRANMPWNFAFEIAQGDWVICPCSVHSLLLVGEVKGDYEHDYHNELGLYGKRRPDFVHARKVQWKEIILKTDKRYHKLNRIGQLTVARPHITFAELQDILSGDAAAA